MPKRAKTIKVQDPSFNEFVYTIASTTDLSGIKNIPEAFKKVLLSPKVAKRFARTASIEKKKEFLSCLGLKSIVVISAVETVWSKQLNKIIKKYEDGMSSSTIPDDEDGLFITTDRNLTTALQTISNAVSSPIYKMSCEMHRAKNRKGSAWDVKLNDPLWEDKKEIEESINRLLTEICYMVDYFVLSSELSSDASQLELRTLIHFYTNRHSYITHDDLVSALSHAIPKNKIRPIERSLLEKIYIQPHADFRTKSFTITSLGMIKIVEFINKFCLSMRLEKLITKSNV